MPFSADVSGPSIHVMAMLPPCATHLQISKAQFTSELMARRSSLAAGDLTVPWGLLNVFFWGGMTWKNMENN